MTDLAHASVGRAIANSHTWLEDIGDALYWRSVSRIRFLVDRPEPYAQRPGSNFRALNAVMRLRHLLSFFPVWDEQLFVTTQPRGHLIDIGAPDDVSRQNLGP